ncbi:MAG: hypothetical protein IPM23_03230 [Candidatus Melainabacteria bacterium]|nr:hypothetical protein [Candidatus Melainabacteria bacterium]
MRMEPVASIRISPLFGKNYRAQYSSNIAAHPAFIAGFTGVVLMSLVVAEHVDFRLRRISRGLSRGIAGGLTIALYIFVLSS